MPWIRVLRYASDAPLHRCRGLKRSAATRPTGWQGLRAEASPDAGASERRPRRRVVRLQPVFTSPCCNHQSITAPAACQNPAPPASALTTRSSHFVAELEGAGRAAPPRLRLGD